MTDGDYFEDKRAGEYQDTKVCDFEERQLDGDLDRRTGEGQHNLIMLVWMIGELMETRTVI